MQRQILGHPVSEVEQVCGPEDVIVLQAAVRDIYIDPLVQRYIVDLSNATRQHETVYLGGSPRGSLALQRLGQARAFIEERDYVLPDDVKELAYPALGHRIILTAQSRVKGQTTAETISDCLSTLTVPGVRARSA